MNNISWREVYLYAWTFKSVVQQGRGQGGGGVALGRESRKGGAWVPEPRGHNLRRTGQGDSSLLSLAVCSTEHSDNYPRVKRPPSGIIPSCRTTHKHGLWRSSWLLRNEPTVSLIVLPSMQLAFFPNEYFSESVGSIQ